MSPALLLHNVGFEKSKSHHRCTLVVRLHRCSPLCCHLKSRLFNPPEENQWGIFFCISTMLLIKIERIKRVFFSRPYPNQRYALYPDRRLGIFSKCLSYSSSSSPWPSCYSSTCPWALNCEGPPLSSTHIRIHPTGLNHESLYSRCWVSDQYH